MVVAVLLTKETAEMMRSQKRKDAQRAKQSKQSSSKSGPANADAAGSGTPPLPVSPGGATRSASSSKSKSAAGKIAAGNAATGEIAAGTVATEERRREPSSGPRLPTRFDRAPDRGDRRDGRARKEPCPPPPPPPRATLIHNSPASHSRQPHRASQVHRGHPGHHGYQTSPVPLPPSPHCPAPNPSFGEEDFGRLVAGIENMGSSDSFGSVGDLVRDNEQDSATGGSSSRGGGNTIRNDRNGTGGRDQGRYRTPSEKAEAASRAAAAALTGRPKRADELGDSNRTQVHSNTSASTTARRSLPAARRPTPITTVDAAERMLESTARDIILGSSGSNESIVISSPSGHSQEHSRDNSRSHSPESFLLEDSLLNPHRQSYDLAQSHSFAITPGAGDNGHAVQVCNPSPVALNASPTDLDWEYANMDHFLDDMASAAGSRDGAGSVGSVTRKRKSDFLVGYGSADSGDGDEKRSRLMYNNSLSSFAQFGAGPIASFGVFGSLSNESAEQPEAQHRNAAAAEERGSSHLDPAAAERGTPGAPVSAETTVLSSEDRLTSPRRSILPSGAPHQPPGEEVSPSVISTEHSHPSKGTLERYDPELYHQLKNARPPQSTRLPPLLVPHDRHGNRLAIIRGSGRKHSEFEVEDVVSSKTHAFYKFLREIYPALEGLRYLLPGLQRRRGRMTERPLLKGSTSEEDTECTINVSEFGNIRLGDVPGMTRAEKSNVTSSDLAIAKQRIECAIYAFGGSVARKQTNRQPQPPADKGSIFRTREPSSSGKKKSKKPFSRSDSLARRERYEKRLRQQYFEHGNRLSWDVQANLSLTLNGDKTFDDDDGPLKKSNSSMDQSENSGRNTRKNRCKKCGQIKQGHVCPFQASLQRSIGVMVYPSANAHVADEPGSLAPALCEMNNFISIKSGSFEAASASVGPGGGGGDGRGSRSVTTATVASAIIKLSNDKGKPSSDALLDINPFRRKTILGAPAVAMCKVIDDRRSDEEEARDKTDEKHSAEGGAEDLLFRPRMEIILDQYRTVTPTESASASSSTDYAYPQVPLTFMQRKSMSDALFSMSKLVPRLTDECALVLTEARKRDQWDLAVAELMAQVICVLHCSPNNDYALDRLRRYLIALGIVC